MAIEWISVNERVPEKPEPPTELHVFAWYAPCSSCGTEVGGARIAIYYWASGQWADVNNDWRYCGECRVTHWAEINPPQEANAKAST